MLRNIPIIFEDKYLLVVSKPSGLLVIPTPKNEKGTLVNILNKEFSREGSLKLHPCHRLDRETSGIIVFAKGKSAQGKMMEEFHKSRVKKVYIAFIQGRLRYNKGEISFPLEGRPAITKYKLIEYDNRGFSMAEVNTLTGRTNQIRIHFKMIGHPLVGDRKFSFTRDYQVKFRRTALHANLLEFRHPFSKEILKLCAPLADDMKVFLDSTQNLHYKYHL